MAEILNRLGQQIQSGHEAGQFLASRVQELGGSRQISVKTPENNGRNLHWP